MAVLLLSSWTVTHMHTNSWKLPSAAYIAGHCAAPLEQVHIQPVFKGISPAVMDGWVPPVQFIYSDLHRHPADLKMVTSMSPFGSTPLKLQTSQQCMSAGKRNHQSLLCLVFLFKSSFWDEWGKTVQWREQNIWPNTTTAFFKEISEPHSGTMDPTSLLLVTEWLHCGNRRL